MGAGLQGVLRCEGTVDRGTYTSAGVVLVCVKFVLDTAIATAFGHTWSYADYWSPGSFAIGDLPDDEGWFFAALLALAVHFAMAGVALTVRRLRDAGLAVWLVVLFFVPFVNLVFFAVLALAPPRVRVPEAAPGGGTGWLARSAWASAAAGVVLTALLGGVLMLFATETLEHYGWGLFVGLPFCLGLLSVLIYANAEERSLSSSIGVGLLSAALACTLLMAVAAEGAICVLMALPLALPLAALGALTGYAVQRSKRGAVVLPPAICSFALVLPGLMGIEALQDAQPAVRPVTTTIVVNAPPEVVWRNVVSFAELPAPRETIFKAGIAYPIGARIEGRGVGAVRRCRFSTGDFVEPITVWDAPRRLAFSVRSQPPPMKELSPYGDVHPPHLDGFLRSRHGEFRLPRLPGGRTRLQGTTWYENRMWPQPYWRAWSDTLIHRIHLRVLRHVRSLSERDRRVHASV
jgi:uncharacterized membrane protein YhaH (DUF805 family)